MDEDFHVTDSLAEKRRRYFAERDKSIAEKKGFRRLEVDSGPKGPQFLMVLLCFLGIALVSFKAFGPSLFNTSGAGVDDIYSGVTTSTETDDGIRIDPTPLQSDLIRLETALFEPAQAGSVSEIVVGVQFEVSRVLTTLTASSDTRMESAARALEEIASRLERADVDSLGLFKGDWVRLRKQHFQHAQWFREMPTDAVTSATSYAVYRDVSVDLLRLVGRTLSDVEDIMAKQSGVGTLDVHQDERDALQAEWRRLTADWSSELRTVRSKMPERPDSPPSGRALAAIQQLGSAFRACENALPADRLPRESDLQTLENVLLRAQLATEAFDGLG